MKKLFYILTILLIVGCAAKKELKESKSSTRETENIRERDSSLITETAVKVSEAIKDEIRTKVPTSSDPEVNRKVDEILSQLNSSKRSGANSYSIRFDPATREIITNMEVARRRDSLRIEELNQRLSEQQSTTLTDEYISEAKKVIYKLPWWVWAIAIWFFRKTILGTIAVIYPPVMAFPFFKRIMNPLNT